jgi:hypothetical protein
VVRIDEDPSLRVQIDAADAVAVDEMPAWTAQAVACCAGKTLEVRARAVGTAKAAEVLEFAQEGVRSHGISGVPERACEGRCTTREPRTEERNGKSPELHEALCDLGGLTDRRSAASAADRKR